MSIVNNGYNFFNRSGTGILLLGFHLLLPGKLIDVPDQFFWTKIRRDQILMVPVYQSLQMEFFVLI
jgi:hypothetical protein